MYRGFYNLAQSMINHQRALDAVTNNLVNVTTSGYKKDQISYNTFQEELIWVADRTKLSGTFAQTYVDTSVTNLEQSLFEFTESPYDIAINGNLYFNIQDELGNTYLTRNGQFEMDGEGYLCLNDSGRILGENGPILLGSDDFEVDDRGNIYNNGGLVDTLQLSYVPADADVAKVGKHMFSYEGDMEIPEGEKYDIIQGAFEKSNVDANKEMTQAMEIQRLFEASSSVLKAIDAINARAATIAKI